MLGQRTNGSYEQDSVRSGEEVSCKTLTQTNQKSKKTDKCIVSGYRPKAGVVDQGTTNLVCRQHEFGMGHLRDPAACYLDSTLSEYRRLRPRQKRFLFFLRFSSQDFPVKRDVEKQIFQTRCRTTSPTLTTSDLKTAAIGESQSGILSMKLIFAMLAAVATGIPPEHTPSSLPPSHI